MFRSYTIFYSNETFAAKNLKIQLSNNHTKVNDCLKSADFVKRNNEHVKIQPQGYYCREAFLFT